MNQIEYRHLMNRACFGCTLPQLMETGSYDRQHVVNELFAKASEAEELNILKPMDIDEILTSLKESSKEDKKTFRKMLLERGVELNIGWLHQMMNSKSQLSEKMTFFWHGHFACRDENPLFLQSLNNEMRSNGLGKFKNLLMAVAKSPAMLKFLNNQQNKKDAPNENFAREVMELFTLGRGNYTEHDIKEAARAFTGWSFERKTQSFLFRPRQHDYGQKEFFNKQGAFDGTDIIDMILEKEECARFITGKIYRFFVNDEADEGRINELAQKFYQSDYDIGCLMKEIFLSDWFYDPKNIGSRIKSPVELVVNSSRLLNADYGSQDTLVFVQKILGQILFLPPNVAGWPNGRRWIDSSSLVFRMEFGKKVIESSELTGRLKADDDNDPNMMLLKEKQINKKGRLNALDAKINWEELSGFFKPGSDEQIFNQASAALLSANIKYSDTGFKISGDSTTAKLKSGFAYLTGRPEFQLC